MRTRILLAAVALIGAGVVIGWIAAPGNTATAAGTLTSPDYAEIEQLYWRYNHGADFRNDEVFLSAFAADAVFDLGTQKFVGREEIAAFRIERDGHDNPDDIGWRHWNNGWRIVPTAEGAEARVYWLLVDVAGGAPNAMMSGYYDDTYTRTPEGWRIKSRAIKFDDGG